MLTVDVAHLGEHLGVALGARRGPLTAVGAPGVVRRDVDTPIASQARVTGNPSALWSSTQR